MRRGLGQGLGGRPIRVVHVTVTHRGSDVRIFYKECRTLAAAGHDVHLVALAPAPSRPGPVVFHLLEDVDGPRYLWRVWPRLPGLLRRLRLLGGDVYHLHDPHLIPLGLALKLRGSRVVYDAHEHSTVQVRAYYHDRPVVAAAHALAWGALERIAGRLFDLVLCATPRIQEGFPAAKAHLVGNFPLAEEFDVWRFDGGRLSQRMRPNEVLYAGGLTGIRGVREMVAAIGLVPAELDAELRLLGDVPEELRAELEAMPGWGRVRELGYRDRVDVLAALARARVGLVCLHPTPNYRESMPLKLFEYMAAGIPVVASDFPLWRRIVGEAGCGLLVDPLDPAAIAEAVTRILRDPGEAEEMGRRGRAAFLDRYNWRGDGRRLVSLYGGLAGAGERMGGGGREPTTV